MEQENHFDVIIIGGSAAGLSAAMTLGRAMRNVLVIDCGTPCNLNTPHSHNFITNDGRPPADILAKARKEIVAYETIGFVAEKAIAATCEGEFFAVVTSADNKYLAKKILLCTGLSDVMPEISGFAACWGNTILHCPYCHGWEVRTQPTGILANGEAAYHLGVLIYNWTKDLTILTNGVSELRNEEAEKLSDLGIKIVETEVARISHDCGKLKAVEFIDGTSFKPAVVYASIPFQQQSDLAEQLGCKINPHGHIEIDDEQRASIEGVYAAGDCTAQQRAVSVAAASGTKAGFTINLDLILR